MPHYCCVIGCTSGPTDLVSFHYLPKDEEKRRIWIKNIKQTKRGLTPSDSSRICSRHFVDGRPTETNPFPILLMDHEDIIDRARRATKTSRRAVESMKELRLETVVNAIVDGGESNNKDDDQYLESDSVQFEAIRVKEEPIEEIIDYSSCSNSIEKTYLQVKREEPDDGILGGITVKEEEPENLPEIGLVKNEESQDNDLPTTSQVPRIQSMATPAGSRLLLLPNGRRLLLPRCTLQSGHLRLSSPALIPALHHETVNPKVARQRIFSHGMTVAPRQTNWQTTPISSSKNITSVSSTTAASNALKYVNDHSTLPSARILVTRVYPKLDVPPRLEVMPTLERMPLPTSDHQNYLTYHSKKPATKRNDIGTSKPTVIDHEESVSTFVKGLTPDHQIYVKPQWKKSKKRNEIRHDLGSSTPTEISHGNVSTSANGAISELPSFQRRYPSPCCGRCEVMSMARLRYDPPDVFISYTGIELDVFEALLIDVKASWENLKAITKDDQSNIPNDQHSLRPKLCEDELLMTLMKLKTNFPASTIAYLFGYETEVVVELLQRWIPYLANWLKSFILWPLSKIDFSKNIPSMIENEFGLNALAILDVFEIKVASNIDSDQTSNAKFVVVYNWNGAVIYRSRLFDGLKTSDYDAINACHSDLGFVSKDENSFLTRNDFYSVTRRSCVANRNCFELDKAKFRFDGFMGRFISKLNQFAILNDGAFPSGLIPCLDEIVTICCVLVNLSSSGEKSMIEGIF